MLTSPRSFRQGIRDFYESKGTKSRAESVSLSGVNEGVTYALFSQSGYFYDAMGLMFI